MPRNPKAREGKGVRQTIQPYRVGSGQEQQVSGTRLGGAELTGWGIGQAWAFGQAGAFWAGKQTTQTGQTGGHWQSLGYRLGPMVGKSSLSPLIGLVGGASLLASSKPTN